MNDVDHLRHETEIIGDQAKRVRSLLFGEIDQISSYKMNVFYRTSFLFLFFDFEAKFDIKKAEKTR
jgi:hypothetical protein